MRCKGGHITCWCIQNSKAWCDSLASYSALKTQAWSNSEQFLWMKIQCKYWTLSLERVCAECLSKILALLELGLIQADRDLSKFWTPKSQVNQPVTIDDKTCQCLFVGFYSHDLKYSTIHKNLDISLSLLNNAEILGALVLRRGSFPRSHPP